MFIFLIIAVGALFGGLLLSKTAGTGPWSLRHFTVYIAVVVRRNLPLGDAVSAYADELTGMAVLQKRMLLNIAVRADEGKPLSEALNCYPHVFSASYRAIVGAGERSGNLAGVLDELSAIAEVDELALRRVAGYALYPISLCLMAGSLYSLIFIFIFPSFDQMFWEMESAGVPPSQAASFGWAKAFVIYGVGLLYVLGVGFIVWYLVGKRWFRGSATLVSILERILWHLPLVRAMERRRAVAQYSVAAGTLLGAGIPMEEGLRLAADGAGNVRMTEIATAAADHVAEGHPLSEAFRKADPGGQLPAEFVWYVQTGENAHNLRAAFARAAEQAAERSRIHVEGLTRLVLPVGVILMGVMVGTMAYTIFSALNQMVEIML